MLHLILLHICAYNKTIVTDGNCNSLCSATIYQLINGTGILIANYFASSYRLNKEFRNVIFWDTLLNKFVCVV